MDESSSGFYVQGVLFHQYLSQELGLRTCKTISDLLGLIDSVEEFLYVVFLVLKSLLRAVYCVYCFLTLFDFAFSLCVTVPLPSFLLHSTR